MFSRIKRETSVLDIGRDRVSLAQFRRKGAEEFEFTGFSSAAIEFGHAGNADACEQLTAFVRAARARFRSACSLTLTLSPHLSLIRTISTPVVAVSKRAKIVEFEASQTIPTPLEEVCWDWRVMTEHAEGLEVCLAAIKTEVICAILAAITAAGSDGVRAVPASLAMRTAFRCARSEAARHPALVVCIGRTATQLLHVDGPRFAARSLAFGWPARDAGAAFSAADDPLVRRLTSEIVRSRVHFQRSAAPDQVPEVYLCGDGPLTDLRAVLETTLSCGVQLFDPLEHFSIAQGCASEIAALDRVTVMSLAGGAASTEFSDEDCINLIPPDLKVRRAFRRRQPALGLAASFAVLALVAPTAYLVREQRALQHALKNCDVEAQRLHAELQRGATYASRLAAANHSAELLREIENSRTAWPTFLAEIERSANLAGDMWLDGLVLRPVGQVAAARQGPAKDDLVEIEISGRAIERSGELGASETPAKFPDQVRRLLANLRRSPLVTAVHDERFESGGPGMLRFAMVITVSRELAL